MRITVSHKLFAGLFELCLGGADVFGVFIPPVNRAGALASARFNATSLARAFFAEHSRMAACDRVLTLRWSVLDQFHLMLKLFTAQAARSQLAPVIKGLFDLNKAGMR